MLCAPAAAGKRGAKARGSKGAAARAAAREETAGSGSEAPQRKAGRVGKKVAAAEAQRPAKKKGVLVRLRNQALKQARKYWYVVLLLVLLVAMFVWLRLPAKDVAA